jgi:hypothetical protein
MFEESERPLLGFKNKTITVFGQKFLIIKFLTNLVLKNLINPDSD